MPVSPSYLPRIRTIAAALAATTALVWLPAPAGAAPNADDVTVTEYNLTDGSRVTTQVRPGRSQLDPARAGKPRPATAAVAVVSPELQTQVFRLAPAATVRVMASVTDQVRLPQFPAHESDEARDQSRAQQSANLVSQIRAEREPAYRVWRGKVAGLGGRITQEYWLGQGFLAELPAAAVAKLAQDPDVRNLMWADQFSPFPADSNAGNDIGVARSLMASDPYRGFARSTDTIALVDSGVNAHTLLSTGSVVIQDETGANPPQIGDQCDHGTLSATTLVGNGNLGASLRGITSMKLHVYQINKLGIDPADGKLKCGTDAIATENAIHKAVADGFKIIIVETQFPVVPFNTISVAADDAFTAGAVVISAGGNFTGNVTAPGNGRNVIAAGAVDVVSFIPNSPQGVGTPDGRFKPDIMTPTNYETGTSLSFNGTEIFTGTSAATAAAGGAAANYWAFLRGGAPTVDPGLVYSGLIASGSHPFPFDGLEGAGKMKLPNGGQLFTFTKDVTNGAVIDIPVNLSPNGCKVTAAIWWPGTENVHANDVDMELITPNNVLAGSSFSGPSVFELIRTTGTTNNGQWRVRLKGFNVSGTQTVYGTVLTCR